MRHRVQHFPNISGKFSARSVRREHARSLFSECLAKLSVLGERCPYARQRFHELRPYLVLFGEERV
jgi:hypothetical protein